MGKQGDKPPLAIARLFMATRKAKGSRSEAGLVFGFCPITPRQPRHPPAPRIPALPSAPGPSPWDGARRPALAGLGGRLCPFSDNFFKKRENK